MASAATPQLASTHKTCSQVVGPPFKAPLWTEPEHSEGNSSGSWASCLHLSCPHIRTGHSLNYSRCHKNMLQCRRTVPEASTKHQRCTQCKSLSGHHSSHLETDIHESTVFPPAFPLGWSQKCFGLPDTRPFSVAQFSDRCAEQHQNCRYQRRYRNVLVRNASLKESKISEIVPCRYVHTRPLSCLHWRH